MRLVAAFSLFLFLLGCKATPNRLTLALNWVPEPEFGGFYEAVRISAFDKRHINIELRPGGSGQPVVQMVAAGQVDFGIAAADEVLIARSNGADIVALFAAYQTAPTAILARKSLGLKTLTDVFTSGKIKTLALQEGLPFAKFLSHSLHLTGIKTVPYPGGISGLLENESYAQQGFITSEPFLAERAKVPTQTFLIADAGYNPYTTVLITHGDRLRGEPEVVGKVVASVREGWKSYLADPIGANQLMVNLNTGMDAETFTAVAKAQETLVKPSDAEALGSMTLERWQTLYRQLLQLEIISNQQMDIKAAFINL